ncbi:MAG: BrnT family toxin [Treponema sp.]|nr:BrnT family toxin [Treponema sp.]
MNEVQFIWDENKNISNICKHGINFNEAAKVFFDPEHLELYDDKHSTANEDRWIIIGNVNVKILLVIINHKTDNLIRIISARRATKNEQEAYYEHNSKKFE